jgi:hypothetical protein
MASHDSLPQLNGVSPNLRTALVQAQPQPSRAPRVHGRKPTHARNPTSPRAPPPRLQSRTRITATKRAASRQELSILRPCPAAFVTAPSLAGLLTASVRVALSSARVDAWRSPLRHHRLVPSFEYLCPRGAQVAVQDLGENGIVFNHSTKTPKQQCVWSSGCKVDGNGCCCASDPAPQVGLSALSQMVNTRAPTSPKGAKMPRGLMSAKPKPRDEAMEHFKNVLFGVDFRPVNNSHL